MLPGYLNGAEDYWTRTVREENMFGLDLHNNTENVWTENGTILPDCMLNE